MVNRQDDPNPLRSLSIALDIIDAFLTVPELGLSELARRVGVAKSTAHRTCSSLAARGLLERTDAGRFRLGVKLYEYGHLVSARSELRAQALPVLVELRNTIGETVQIGVPSEADVLYVERVPGLRALRFITDAHRRSPVHRSSSGKALAAFLPELAARRLRAGLPASTGYTIVVPKLFLKELERVRQRGYATSTDETEIGLSSVAVPVRGRPDGPVVAAISVAGPTSRVVGEHMTHHAALLSAAALRVTEALVAGQFALPNRAG